MRALAQSTILAAAVATASIHGVADAAVYKYIDENGNVAYGDKPIEGSTKFKIHGERAESKPAEKPSKADRSRESADDADGNSNEEENVLYEELLILTPKPGKVINSNAKSVQVIFLPTPPLGKSDQLVITLDGKEVSKGRDANLSVSNLTNGSHTIVGKITNAEGKTKITSSTVTFQVGNGAALALDDN